MDAGNPSNTFDAVALLASNMKAMHARLVRDERVVMFMDNSNFYGSVARVGRDSQQKYRVDYSKLYKVLMAERFGIDAFCYCSQWDTDPESRIKRDNFQAMMQKAGFSLVKLPGAVREKGLDAAIVRDMVSFARDCPRADTFVLIAGDGDYADTIRELRRKHGVKVEVAFFGSETAYSLKDAAYQFIDLEGIKNQIQLDRPFLE